MRFEEIHIQNFRNIKDMTIRFQPGVSLLIGDNGVGKTAVLTALAISLNGYLRGISEKNVKKGRGIRQEDMTIGCTEATVLSPSVCMNGHSFSWEVRRQTPNAKDETKYIGNKKMTEFAYANYTGQMNASSVPVISYQGIDRVVLENSKTEKAIVFKSRAQGYEKCLESVNSFSTIEAWCLKMETVKLQDPQASVSEYDAFQRAVLKFYTAMEGMPFDPSVQAISYNRKLECIVLSQGEKKLPITMLSSGYQAILHLVMDVAFRMAQLNPECTDFETVSGVVLIDEIDMHLHPNWQWRILNALQETFPSVQIIATTHAPIVISSHKNAHLISIEKDQSISYPASTYGEDIGDIAELTQGSFCVPEDLKKLYHAFEDAFIKRNQEVCGEILRKIGEKYGTDHTFYKKADTRMKMRRSW